MAGQHADDSYLIDDDGKPIRFAEAFRDSAAADEPAAAAVAIAAEPPAQAPPVKRGPGRPKKAAIQEAPAPMAPPAPQPAAPAPTATTRASVAGKQPLATRTSAAPMAGTSSGPGRYRVTLNCPTPLAARTLEVDAQHEEDAREQFCAANGISSSSHPWTIERVG